MIGDALKKNHTILGIHLMGNEAKVDEMGFVIPEKDQDHASHHVFTRIPCKYQSSRNHFYYCLEVLKTGVISSKNLIELNVTSKCWVCEGWSNLEFKISKGEIEAALMLEDVGISKNGKLYVNLHMSFDGYRPHFMDEGFDNGANMFQLYKMAPPGSLYYFYSIGNLQTMGPEAMHKVKTLTDGYNPIMVNEK